MATNTTNYSLYKKDPVTDGADTFNITTMINENLDKIDSALTPTADPAQVPAGNAGKLVQWVGWLTNRIKAITGKTNWYDAPDTTLAALNASIGTLLGDTGAANAYAVTLNPAPTSYTAGMSFRFLAVHANTGASTVNANNLDAKSIKMEDGSDPVAGTIPANSIVSVVYDGTNFRFIATGLATHKADEAPHGAVSTATASKIAIRDASGQLYAKNRANVTDGVWATNEVKSRSVNAAATLVSDTIIATLTFYLVVVYTSSTGFGVYTVGRMAGTAFITTLVPITDIAISLDGTYEMVITNNTASAKTISLNLIKVI